MAQNTGAARQPNVGGITERARYLFWLSRPHWWVHLILPIAFAILFAAETIDHALTATSAWFLLYFTLPGNLFVYGINDAFDVDTDQINARKTDDETPSVIFQHDPINAVAIACSGLLMGTVAFVTTDPQVLALLGGLAVAAIVYNVPPIRLKGTPILDSITTSALLLPPIAAYTAVAGTLPPVAIIAGAWLWGMGYHLLGAIEDIEPDRNAGLETTATLLGRKRSLAYFLGLWILAPLLVAVVTLPGAALLSVYPLALGYTLATDTELERLYNAMPIINLLVFGVATVAGVLTIL